MINLSSFIAFHAPRTRARCALRYRGEDGLAIACLLSPFSSGVTGINRSVDAGSAWDARGGLRDAAES
jgi:hypothetical protein